MVTPNAKLASSLAILKTLQDKGLVAIKASELTRTHRERLMENGFLREVTKGWYIIKSSQEKEGDTTSWYHAYWPFSTQFLNHRYNNKCEWSLHWWR